MYPIFIPLSINQEYVLSNVVLIEKKFVKVELPSKLSSCVHLDLLSYAHISYSPDMPSPLFQQYLINPRDYLLKL